MDVRTIVFADTINFIVCTCFVAALWRQNRTRFAGLQFLVAAFSCQTVAVFLIMLRGVIPDLVSISFANALVFTTSILALMGLERFVGKVRSQWLNFTLLGIYSVIFISFAINPVSLGIRNYAVTIGLLLIWAQPMWLMLVRTDRELRPVTFSVGLVYAGFCLTNLIRLGHYLTSPMAQGDYMKAGAFEVIALLAYDVLTVALTIALVMMVNKRLAMELKSREETFSAAFRAAPYGLTLTSLEDGTIFEVNEGFTDLTGYTREEVLGRSTLELSLWQDSEHRQEIVDELLQHGKIRDREQRFRRKSGEMQTGVFCADIITIGNRRCILTGLSDISRRKQMEDEIRNMSLRDSLTGLLNRRGFFVMTEQKFKEANRTGTKLQLVYIDANDLKKINDSFGHDEGDRALQDLAQVLTATFREMDIVARMGGDEFTVCFTEPQDTHPEKALERLQHNIADINEQHARPYHLAISFGTSTYDPLNPRSIDELLSQADKEMYRHKQSKSG
nr:sensor domain-containing diguanylate cyclase [Geoanaerobacter pelophilus]